MKAHKGIYWAATHFQFVLGHKQWQETYAVTHSKEKEKLKCNFLTMFLHAHHLRIGFCHHFK